MKVPKYIEEKIIRRAECAERFLDLDSEIAEWLESKGFDTGDPQITDHIRTGAESLCSPWVSVKALIDFIEGDGLREGEKFE